MIPTRFRSQREKFSTFSTTRVNGGRRESRTVRKESFPQTTSYSSKRNSFDLFPLPNRYIYNYSSLIFPFWLSPYTLSYTDPSLIRTPLRCGRSRHNSFFSCSQPFPRSFFTLFWLSIPLLYPAVSLLVCMCVVVLSVLNGREVEFGWKTPNSSLLSRLLAHFAKLNPMIDKDE